MSVFGTPITQSIAGIAPVADALARDVRKRDIQNEEKRRAAMDVVELNVEASNGVAAAGAGRNDLRQRQAREPYSPAKKKPALSADADGPRLDVAG